MWHLGTWDSVGLGSDGLAVQLDDLRGLSQPKYSYICLNTQGSIQDKMRVKMSLNEDWVLRNGEIFGGTCNELTSWVCRIN